MARTPSLFALLLLVPLACHADRSITHGIASEEAWTQRLAAAIPPGTTADSARTTMETNGFHCKTGVDSVATLVCSKSTNGLVSEKWWAILNFDRRARVYEERAFYGLTGP